MGSPMFTEYPCWTRERAQEVINIEALSIDLPTFLATHVPLHEIRYLKAPSAMPESRTSEADFLEKLIERGREGLHTFAVVLGAPGTGKSHLIRWLKERYERDYGDGDVVLLIARDKGNLRDMIRQLLEMPVFDTPELHERLEQLRTSVGQLAAAGLADVLLAHLITAGREASPPPGVQFNPRIVKRLEGFLLDQEVRKELKCPDRGIDRIVQHLTSRGGTGGKRPEFDAKDFAFSPDLLHRMGRGGYEDAVKLVRDLDFKEAMREELARYLNFLLPVAIGRSAALSSTDLSDLFFDLRRYLRTQGKGLALFVEDVTAFAGLDEGLIDVLVKQHTGEGEAQYCRLTSVIGITNAFYESRIPTHIRHRLTFLLTLNRGDSDGGEGGNESDLLSDSAITGRFAAQYLNAMRLPQRRVKGWFDAGANLEALPNACIECPFREPCHAAFGAARSEEGGIGFGYYPFNERAIWTMYQNLDETRVSKTPRALLNNILLYVLLSHGDRVKAGTFPPERTKMCSDITAPTLRKPAQRGILEQSGVSDWRRNESLAVFWGDRTIDATKVDREVYVGELSPGVFEAFAVTPVWDGVGIEERPAPPIPPDKPESSAPPPPSEENPHIRPLQEWIDGKRLTGYGELQRWIREFLATSIDWTAHGISGPQLSDRLPARKLAIEGQDGQIPQEDVLIFPRNTETFEALVALSDLRTRRRGLDDRTTGGHLATIHLWLREQESKVVDFVRSPHEGMEAVPLDELAVIDGLLLAWLGGALSAERHTDEDLFLATVAFCGGGQTWGTTPPGGAAAWRELAAALQPEYVSTCLQLALGTLTRSQGGIEGSSNVRFLDAARGLDIVHDFREGGWLLPERDGGKALPGIWKAPDGVRALLTKRLEALLSGEEEYARQLAADIDRYVGDGPSVSAFQAISHLLEEMRHEGENHGFALEAGLTHQELDRVRERLRALAADGSREARILALADRWPEQRADVYRRNLHAFEEMATTKREALKGRIANLKSTGARAEIDSVEGEYVELTEALHEVQETLMAAVKGGESVR